MSVFLSQTASALHTGSWFGRRARVNCDMCAPRHLPGAATPQACRLPQCQGRQQQRAQTRMTRLRDAAALALLGLAALSPTLDLLP